MVYLLKVLKVAFLGKLSADRRLFVNASRKKGYCSVAKKQPL